MLIIISLRYQGTARLMFNSFSSSLWMLPFSKYCRADNKYWKHFSGGSHVGHHTYHCDEQEFCSKFSGWPTNVINIEIPSNRGEILSLLLMFVDNILILLGVSNCLFVFSACRI